MQQVPHFSTATLRTFRLAAPCSALRTRRHANLRYVGLRIKEKIWVSTLPARKIRAVIPKINVSIVSIYNIIFYFIYYIEELRFTTAGHDTLLIVSVRVPSCPQTIQIGRAHV